MSRFERYTQKLLSLLQGRTAIAGLEINERVLRLAYHDGKAWQLHTIRLEPGVIENGKVKDNDKFLSALDALRMESKLAGKNKDQKISVVVSLSSVNVYSQVFNLPVLSGDALLKAVDLNLQMLSPGQAGKMNSGWEVVSKEEHATRLDVLSAFIDRETVDEIVQTLSTAGFLAVAVEPRSIALTRILREKGAGIDLQKAYLYVQVDDAGIDFLIIRKGLPYFEYSNQWKDVAGKNGEIPLETFEADLAASLRQVINFYSQHWVEPIGGVIIASAALNEVIEKTVALTAPFPIVRLTLEMGQPISSEWLVAIGCSLRRRDEQIGEEVSLLGPEWESRLQEEQVFRFAQFWQVMTPIAFGLLIAVLWVAAGSFGSQAASLESASTLSATAAPMGEITAFEASTTQFNDLVAMAQTAESSTSETYLFLNKIETLANADGVTINHLSFPGNDQKIVLNGSAPSEDRIIAFKAALQGDSSFSAIDLPLTSVQNTGGTYVFLVTFKYQ